MEPKFVITINRRCGSKGATVGRKIAEKLGVDFFDKDLIDLESAQTATLPMTRVDERVKNSLLSRIAKGEYDGVLLYENDPDFEEYNRFFESQATAIREHAEEGNCVVVGRCADFVLEDMPGRVSVFITAHGHDCIQNEMQRLSITNKQSKDRFQKINAYREAYYLHFTGREWMDESHYDLVLSTSDLSVEECADQIIAYLDEKLKAQTDA